MTLIDAANAPLLGANSERRPTRAEETYARTTSDERVIVVGGNGSSLTVHRGHLVVRDGEMTHRRERLYSKIERKLRRILVVAQTGTVTLDAIRWCADVGITIVHLRSDGTVLGEVGYQSRDDAALRRAQAVGGTPGHPAALAVTRMLLRAKLLEQASVLHAVFGDRVTAGDIRAIVDEFPQIVTVDAARGVEGNVAAMYWTTWSARMVPRWDKESRTRVPAHWQHFAGRVALTRAGTRNRGATDPVNAALNYGYAVAETECRLALLGEGLDPGLGALHVDTEGRSSLALDLLEAVRPAVDRAVLNVFGAGHGPGAASWRWFTESDEGRVRLLPPLTHVLAEHAAEWGSIARPYASRIAEIFRVAAEGHPIPDVAPVIERRKPARIVRRPACMSDEDMVKIGGSPADVLAVLSGATWDALAKLLPVDPRVGRPGARPIDHRSTLAAILLYMNGHRIPADVGASKDTAFRRFATWKSAGVWSEVRRVLIEAK